MANLIVLVGPPGSGKSTLAKKYEALGFVRINQDDQGREAHKIVFADAIAQNKDIIVDRMNFNKEQRERYLSVARAHGYETWIEVLHESYQTCFDRCIARKHHPTITDNVGASKALGFFFKSYERPTPDEANDIRFRYPGNDKPLAVICDLDGTLCDMEHRRHFVNPTDGSKKNWKKFSEGLVNDTPHLWCRSIIKALNPSMSIVYCSGRDSNYRQLTEQWLKDNDLALYDNLFMRSRDDFRQDCIVKENILDFEILTRYTPHFFLDDRKQVVDMWRRRGFTCLQCAEGDF